MLSLAALAAPSAKSPDVAPVSAANGMSIPLLEKAPSLSDFEGMKPNGPAIAMARASGFVDAEPNDGTPISQRTEAYIGYDAKNLYVVFVCFDDPKQIRAQMGRRENVFDDDFVEVTLDTFKDQRRGFLFWLNPLGIQADAIWSEGLENAGPDWSFDTVWHSEGKRTDQGYMTLFEIPFRSLRFNTSGEQTWGLALTRNIQRTNEWAYWPRISSKIKGRLNQAATVTGLKNISPGRNLQFIPYGIMRSYRALDDRGASPRFAGETIAGDIGLDAKAVIKDRFVLDVTVNPDFSQVESDEPQNTVNQRFEVNFPEKRPFFLENANFFDTPIGLNFTRRIVDPNYGVRLTGRTGPYSIGAIFADDSSPGKSVLRTDPLNGKNALFGLLRINRDIFGQSSVGMIYTHREFEGDSNRVGGVDFNLKWHGIYNLYGQSLASSTKFRDGTYLAGPAHMLYFGRLARNLRVEGRYTDVGTNFITDTGYFQRPDIRRIAGVIQPAWRPEGKALTRVMFTFHPVIFWDRQGQVVSTYYENTFEIGLTRNTYWGAYVNPQVETLRPADFSTLGSNRDFQHNTYGSFFGSNPLKWMGFNGEIYWGQGIHFLPADVAGVAQPPQPARKNGGNLTINLRPVDRLQIANTYLYQRQWNGVTNTAFFNSHILRSKWNYQINKELSVRVIGQYEALLANPLNSALESGKRINADFLVTYYLNPGTAFYVGYNSNLSTTDPSLAPTSFGYRQTRDRFINDGRVFFIKLSYLFRF